MVRAQRAPGKGFHRTPATCLAGIGMDMGTGPHCSKRHRARGFVQAQNGGTNCSITKSYQSHGLMPCLHGLWSGEQMLSPKVNSGRQKLIATLPGKTHPERLIQRDSSEGDSSHLPQGRPHHLGRRKSRGGRTPLVHPVSPTPLVPRCHSSLSPPVHPCPWAQGKGHPAPGPLTAQTSLSPPVGSLWHSPQSQLQLTSAQSLSRAAAVPQ